jgi:hypothetical protein
MPNNNAPFGFRQYYGGSGGAPTFAENMRRVSAAYTTPIYSGDPLMAATGPATGYLIQAAPGTARVEGICNGVEFFSTVEKKKTWANYWPGTGASGDVHVKVIDDPNAQFEVMGNGTVFSITGTPGTHTSSVIGQYAQFAIGTGNTMSGRSGAYLASVGTTVTFPFIVRGLINSPPGAAGADVASAYNSVIVGFNNQGYRTNGAGPLGIA